MRESHRRKEGSIVESRAKGVQRKCLRVDGVVEWAIKEGIGLRFGHGMASSHPQRLDFVRWREIATVIVTVMILLKASPNDAFLTCV